MKKFLLYITFLLASGSIYSQQDYQITHYMFDNLSFNPGYAGMNKNICATMIGRQQWSGFAGSPTTALVNIHSPISLLRGGLGLTYVSDQLGFEKNSVARLNYSYHLSLGSGQLGIGLSAGIIQKSIDAQWKTPSGNPAFVQSAASSKTEIGANSDGFNTIELPVAIAGAIFLMAINKG